MTGMTGVAVLASAIGCATRGKVTPRDGIEESLCRTAPGADTELLANGLLDALDPEVEIAVLEFRAASPNGSAAWGYEAHLFTQRASIHASSVRLGVDLDGERRADVPMAPRVVAPLIGESVPAAHWEWVEIPPVCRFADPSSDDPLCRVLAIVPPINPFAYALWPVFLPGRGQVRREPTWEDWEHIAPQTTALFEAMNRLIPGLPEDTDWMRTDMRTGILVFEAPPERSSLVLSMSVDAWACDRRIAIDVALPLESDKTIEAWLAEHRIPKRTEISNTTVLRVRELGSTADLQLDDRDAVEEFLRGTHGVSCSCALDQCTCRRAGPALLRSDGLGPFSWKTPLCCASEDWATDGKCSCSPVGCARSERRDWTWQRGAPHRRCICSDHGGMKGPGWIPVERCDPIAPEVCCVDAYGCSCTTHRGPCYGDEVAVDSCEPQTVTCRAVPEENPILGGAPGYGVPVASCEPP